MFSARTRSRKAVLAVAALGVASLGLSACGGSSSSDSEPVGTADPNEEVTIVVDSFGGIFANYEEAGLLDQYREEHPNVTIEFSEVQQEPDYWTALGTKLNSGSGLADIQPIEISRAALVTSQQQDTWLDVNDTEFADQLEEETEAAVSNITTEDGAVLGFPTDAGPMAICYRTDKMEAAGLPSDSEELAAQVTDWDAYEALGQQYVDATGQAWTDTATGYYRLLTSVEPVRNYDEEGNPTWDSNDTVKPSFDRAAAVAAAGLTAGLEQFSPAWNTAMSTGDFATIACPAWMLGYIKQQAGEENAGNWSAIPLPEDLGGNWGGSYLAIPRDSENAAAAADLAAFLTSAEAEAAEFEAGLAFPSNTVAQEQIQDVTDEYFSGAPIGEIFSTSAQAAPAQPLGVDDGAIDVALTEALVTVEANGVSPEDAWQSASSTIEDQVG
ncbi:ABC transporter substrate-binding protein [uncultured Pseudokineococcus sp.]|uniref:ABC transporter substrate-binding protein n=1 Tax=uncultured Pseudokineococcus sp. TaxID=1642928 RepID=UPI0026303862|nr:ABC transporter substrate-binding protein [uncultured Pseudokineococcus sp.]